MRKAGFDPRRAINGNYGEVMLDGELGQRGYGVAGKSTNQF